MKKNKVDINNTNSTLISLIENPKQKIVLDANFFIPPDRSEKVRGLHQVSFTFFKDEWINPIFDNFENIAIHEAVYDEVTKTNQIKNFVDSKINNIPTKLNILKDSSLNYLEKALRNEIELYVSAPTNYDPSIDNRDDRGEVKSLSYMATRGLIYFCSHDANALNLIENSSKLGTRLNDVQAVHTYEIIYYLYKTLGAGNKLRYLYKYMYYISREDKKINPEWGKFIEGMNILYPL